MSKDNSPKKATEPEWQRKDVNKCEKIKFTTKAAGDLFLDEKLYKEVIKNFSQDVNISTSSKIDIPYNDYRIEFSKIYDRLARNISSSQNEAKLASEIANLRLDIANKAKQITELASDAANKEEQLEELKKDRDKLKEIESLAHLLSRVGQHGKEQIQNDSKFRAKFINSAPCDAFVLSIDIRRSTELMLKASDPNLYAQFILKLAQELKQCVLNNFGIFDKFTGDGILGFYPSFYSGDDAGYFAVTTAIECHKIFNTHYSENMDIFNSVLLDTGLGIGLDFGKVQIVDLGGEITVVGAPVVYACRMSGANAGNTYANHPAYVQINNKYDIFNFTNEEITIKHEGKSLAHSVIRNEKKHTPTLPNWLKPEENDTTGSDCRLKEEK